MIQPEIACAFDDWLTHNQRRSSGAGQPRKSRFEPRERLQRRPAAEDHAGADERGAREQAQASVDDGGSGSPQPSSAGLAVTGSAARVAWVAADETSVGFWSSGALAADFAGAGGVPFAARTRSISSSEIGGPE